MNSTTMPRKSRQEDAKSKQVAAPSRPLLLKAAGAITLVVILVSWTIATWGQDDLGYEVLPAPTAVIQALGQWSADGYGGSTLLESLGVSTWRMIVGWVLAVGLGTVLGIAMGMIPLVNQVANPWFQFYRALPPLGYISLLVLWFGVGEPSKIILLVLTGLPPVIVAVPSAVGGIRRERIDGARTLGVSGWKLYRFVVFPSILPALLTSARVAMGFVIASLIGAEMIAANSGIAWTILRANNRGDVATSIAGILIMSALAICADVALRQFQRRLTPWVGKS